MKCREFLNLYGDWSKTVYITNNCFDIIARGKPAVVLSYRNTYEKEVVSFRIVDNELFIRVK